VTMRAWGGVACLIAVVAIGVAVGRGPVPDRLDGEVRQHLHSWLERRSFQGLLGQVAAERRAGHGTYATAALPLLAAGVVAAVTALTARRGGGPRPQARRWAAWVVVLLLTVPLAYGLRVAFGRPGPGDLSVPTGSQGAYPSGGALLVALGWTIGGAVLVWLRPSWRRPVVALALLALAGHAFARVAVGDHWLTDVLGSYLLAAGVALLADRLRPRGRDRHTG
jgi:hypothetical protein